MNAVHVAREQVKRSVDPAAAEFEKLVGGAAAPGGAQMVGAAQQNVQDTLNSFRSYDADQLHIQLEWVAQGRARVLVNGEPLLSDAGLPLTLFTRGHRAARTRRMAQQAAA